jgi:EF hand
MSHRNRANMKRSLPTLLLFGALATAQAPGKPTFTEHVAPIVFHSCAQCHRPGEAAPFALLSYQDVRKRAKMIRKVVDDRYMPPWHPAPGFGEFQGCLRLPDADVAVIDAWVAAGMPEGPADKLPALPKFTSGWQLGEPDLVVKMTEPFEVPASGRDLYRNFTVPVDLDTDKWITAIEVRPSARAVLHHVLFFVDERRDGEQNGRGNERGFRDARLFRMPSLGGWAVGGRPEHLPEGLAMRLPAHSDIVLQSHLHPSGKKEKELITLGVYFAKEPPSRTLVPIQLPPFFGIAAGLRVPPGVNDFKLTDEFELPCAIDALTVGGHAHMICKSMRLYAVGKDGDKTPLLLIRNWDFDWQNRYTYKAPVRLPAGTVIKAEITYDNSKDNPNNPNQPPKEIHWGRETTDEMGSITLYVAAADEGDTARLIDAVQLHTKEKVVGKERLADIDRRIDEMFTQYDKNKDGKLSRDEIPARMRRAFDFLDKNHDGVLDKDEAKALGGLGGFGGPGGGRGRGGNDE